MAEDITGDRRELEGSTQGAHVPALVTSYAIPPVIDISTDTVGLHELTSALWRRKTRIVLAAALGVLIGAGFSLWMAPVYRARVSLQLEGFSSDQFMRDISPIAPSLPNSTPENYLQNQVKLMESETLAKRVAEKLETGAAPAAPTSGTFADRWRARLGFLQAAPISPEEQRAKDVQKALTVRTSLQSQVLEVFYDASDPGLAARGANLAASEFINLNREARWQLAQDTTDWLNKQAADLKAALETSNQQLLEYARSAGLVFAGKEGTLAADRMTQIQDALAKAEADRATKQARYEAAAANPDSLMSDAVATGPLRQYEENLQKLRQELADLQTLYTPTNYKVQRVQAQIKEVEKTIAAERDNALRRLRTEYQAGSGLERLLSQAQDVRLKTVEQQMEKERQYEIKKSEIDSTQRLYEVMIQKVKEAGAASAMRTTNVRMIDSAGVPAVPYSPNPPLNIAIGFAIGTLGGIALALLGQGGTKVSQPGESVLLDVPELGVIPSAHGVWAKDFNGRRLSGYQGRQRELGLVTHNWGSSVIAESFRAALTSILLGNGLIRASRAKHGGRVLVLTSIDVMEGKTTVLTNLGIAAAERKQRVLLIDADLRRPRLNAVVDVANTWGLSDLLQQSNLAEVVHNSPIEALVRTTHVPGLSILPAGPVHAATHSLLHSPNVDTLLRRFRKEFDLILIDTPPMMLYADVRALGRRSDGVVMVVRANTKSREDLRDAYLKFMQDRTPVLGTILNDWKMDPGQTRAYGRYHNHYRPRPA